jgi:hypothetical protein
LREKTFCQADLKDENFVLLLQDVVSDPANAAKYADNPRISRFLEKVLDPRWLAQRTGKDR